MCRRGFEPGAEMPATFSTERCRRKERESLGVRLWEMEGDGDKRRRLFDLDRLIGFDND